ncbi:hypothetical protein V5O48_018740 [Marasmius crinis-equi]|uniref:Uncharacterized protein n=1 Tax=Marasmius crinis-equi TaxID=585013 RepID=A0ABR3EKG9_9AGAR
MAPAKWTFLCKCERSCGGQYGPGRQLNSYPTYRRHLKENAEFLAANLIHGPSPFRPPRKNAPNPPKTKTRLQPKKPTQTAGPSRSRTVIVNPANLENNGHTFAEGLGSRENELSGEDFDMDGSDGPFDQDPMGSGLPNPDAAAPASVSQVPSSEEPSRSDNEGEGEEGMIPPRTESNNLRDRDVHNPEDENIPHYTPNFVPRRDDFKITLSFIEALKSASLDSTLEPLDLLRLERHTRRQTL